MSTTIEWTHVPGYRGDVWNPTTGCSKVSQGCKHCYAETMHRRLHAMGVKGYERPFLDGARPVPERLHKPLKTKTPTAYFVNSMSDLFHADVPFSYIDQVFAVMALCPQHLFLILTKRPERMAEYLQPRDPLFLTDRYMAIGARMNALRGLRVDEADPAPMPLPNVWLGTSVEDQATADARIPHLLRCPAVVRFLSCEPLLGAVDLRWDVAYERSAGALSLRDALHWVIAGGESGPKARPMHPDWARGLRDQCQAAGVPFFFKQWGEYLPFDQHTHEERERLIAAGVDQRVDVSKVGKARAGRLLDGRDHYGWPKGYERWEPKDASFGKKQVKLHRNKEHVQP